MARLPQLPPGLSRPRQFPPQLLRGLTATTTATASATAMRRLTTASFHLAGRLQAATPIAPTDSQFAGPRDREDIDSDSDREADNDGAGREAVSASTADDDVGSSRGPVEEIDSDAQPPRT